MNIKIKLLKLLKSDTEQIVVGSKTGKFIGNIFFSSVRSCDEYHQSNKFAPKKGDKLNIDEWFLCINARELYKVIN